jgi:hypothetical protein
MSQVLSPKSLEFDMCNLNHSNYVSWDLPLHQGPESQVPSMTQMSTWQYFLEERLGKSVESWVKQKATLNMIFSVTYYLDLHNAISFHY